MHAETLKAAIRDVPDFPKPGILFKDITPVLAAPALFQGAVKIDGDTETGQAFQDLLADVDWDWEEQLSRVTGDVIAHQTGKLAKQAKQLLSDSRDTLAQDCSEYLQEEAQWLPTQIEVDYFLADVDRLRDDVARLEARVKRLLQAGDPPS